MASRDLRGCLRGSDPAGRPGQSRSPSANEQPISAEVDSLRRQIDRLSASVPGFTPELDAQELASNLIAPTAGPLGTQDFDREFVRHALSASLASLSAPPLPYDSSPRVVAVIGPLGVGKTTALIQLAVPEGLAHGYFGVMISADGTRVGGADQLRAFASILGLPFEAASFPESLDRLLIRHRDRPRIWIDTSGYSPADFTTPPEIRRFFQRHPAIERHLVLSAAMRPADLTSVVDRFAGLEPTHLLITHVDEASALGPIVNERPWTGLPLSYFLRGTRIPGDFEPASPGCLADILMSTCDTRKGEPTAPRLPPRERRQAA